jgi:WD40 repeat protein
MVLPRWTTLRHCLTAWLAAFVLAFLNIAPAWNAMAQEGHGLLDATPEATSAWRVSEERDLAIDGQLVALSPDGEWIAGIGPDGGFCVWKVATGDPVCEAPRRSIDPRSIAWAPDSTAVAYTGDALLRLEDTDILVFELAAGETTNLTDDGYEGQQITARDAPSTVSVDVFPTWTPDSQALVFARTNRVFPNIETTDVMTVARTGGEPTLLHTAHPTLPLSVNSPIFVLGDGTVLFVVASHQIGDDLNGVWRLDPDGTATMLMPGNRTDPFPIPTLADVRESATGTVASGSSRQPADIFAPFAFELDVETGEVTPNSSDPATGLQVLAWTYAPDGASTVGIVLEAGAPSLVITNPDGSQTDLGEVELAGPAGEIRIGWAENDTILVPHPDGGGTLLTVAIG